MATAVPVDLGEPLLRNRTRKHKEPLTIMRLLKESYSERWLLFWGSVALVVSTVTSLAVPIFIGRVVDELVRMTRGQVSPSEAKFIINATIFELVLVVSVGGVFAFLRGYLFTLSGERIVARIRKQLFQSCVRQDISMFDKTRTVRKVVRAFHEFLFLCF